MGRIPHGDSNICQRPANITTVLLGEYRIDGFVADSGVANYLGVPYAEIPARFRQARRIQSSKLKGTYDATRYGPICPQNVDVPRKWRDHLYQGIVTSDALSASEFECLNLNIYAPIERAGQPLPVFVWVHGGGWVVGDGGPEYDGNFLVQHSSKLGLPFIYVALNYRLGYFGFSYSKELRAEAVAAGEVPFANVGLHDQRLALMWVQGNIHHFGGDASNVTIAGESAGAWSVLAHLRSNVPLFRRAMIMSAPSLAPQGAEGAQRDFDSLLAVSGLDATASDRQKLDWLRNLSVDSLLKVSPPSLIFPIWDPEWFSHEDSSLPLDKIGDFPNWCDGIIVGWTKDETALFGMVRGWNLWSIDMIRNAIRLAIPDMSLADEVLRVYNIINTPQDVKSALKGLIQFTSDGSFGSLMESMRSYTATPISIYRFDQVDPFEHSPFLGYAYHALDNAFICRLPAVAGAEAPKQLRITADAYTKSVCEFVHGRQPWVSSGSSQKIQSFNGFLTGLVEWTGFPQWNALATTADHAAMLKRGARALMSMKAEQLC
ncbi:uncharacterized protein Z519_01014 [Cladophialophora bantiana CBS 173.52]|uniref:Carboxylic ester hydrolase n=1 Tax=Cladophialophora bantiana (strain ATCC 10958 / CBS 173.52 / CDC B-1940 / NIH 8579) TaxID=1442370 RepID=A0A0D2I2L9_CLAB1|nr:uncharacterized protein Z519_01014 [Cladophialophora bantiana CBS 173.52]KIW97430.1 hypothetical protein Z519_01014 [Cladophialophora bantiana CBS 173.52]